LAAYSGLNCYRLAPFDFGRNREVANLRSLSPVRSCKRQRPGPDRFTGGKKEVKLIALMPVRNEDWCVGLTARAVLMWCDELICLLHNCTDRSAEILIEINQPERLHIFRDLSPEWTEMRHRQMLLDAARIHGATHIATIDADEILTGNLIDSCEPWETVRDIRDTIEELAPGEILHLPRLAMPGRTDRYLVEGPWAHEAIAVAWKDDPRFHWNADTRKGYDFHHRNPMVTAGASFSQFRLELEPGLMHLQFCDRNRLRAKDALYQMTEILRWPGQRTPYELAQMYGNGVHGSDPQKYACLDVPDSWWAPYRDLMGYLHLDAEPWQKAECERLWREHGPEKFAGLDLLGIVGEGK
jgi:hypothetical protein